MLDAQIQQIEPGGLYLLTVPQETPIAQIKHMADTIRSAAAALQPPAAVLLCAGPLDFAAMTDAALERFAAQARGILAERRAAGIVSE